jgi:hypothetical protein
VAARGSSDGGLTVGGSGAVWMFSNIFIFFFKFFIVFYFIFTPWYGGAKVYLPRGTARRTAMARTAR